MLDSPSGFGTFLVVVPPGYPVALIDPPSLLRQQIGFPKFDHINM